MRRLIQWWYRRQHAPKAPPMTPEQEAALWIAEAERRRKVLDTPPDAPAQPAPAPEPPPSNEVVQAQVTAIGNACWPEWQPPIRALPRRVQRQIPQIAREAAAGNGASFRLFTARHLPLMLGMDAEAIAEWHPTAQMMLRSACVVMRPELRARLATVGNADASLTIYAPRDWLTNVPLRPVIEQHLVAAVSSATGVPIRDVVRATWDESDGPYLWSVELWDSANWQEVA